MAFPTDWGRRCALVIQSGQVTDNEVNFPLLVTEDTLPSEIFDADGSYPALDGGGDIRFSSDEAGNTQLACEIESFVTDNDPANGKAAIWVKVPSLSSSTNTTIYIWYNKAGESQPAEDSAYGKENVWDSGFVMVQHMNQIPDGTADEIVDSTSNDNDGTTSGMDSADQVAGQIDGSLDFDGGDDYVDVINSVSLNPQIMSMSAWIKSPVYASTYDSTVISKRYGAALDSFDFIILDNDIFFEVDGGVDSPKKLEFSDGNWHHIIGTFDNTAIRFYFDGIEVGSGTSYSSAVEYSAGALYIGWRGSGTVFNGTIDEVRISNIARSAGWIATEYNNQNAPGTFLIEGTPETPGAAPITFIPQIIMF